MRETIDFVIPCNPPKSTHQGSSRIMKRKDGTQFVGKSSNSKGAASRSTMTTLFMQHAPADPMLGPVSLTVRWGYFWRKAEAKKNRAAGFRWCDTIPDCDNIVKMVEDVLCDLRFYVNDSQVADLSFKKFWCSDPHIRITLKELSPLNETDVFEQKGTE